MGFWNGRPTVAAAKSLLSWVYITMAGEQVKDNTMWAKAASKAKEVIDNAATYGIKLEENYADLWLVNNRYNKESIFALNFADGLGDNQCGAGVASDQYRVRIRMGILLYETILYR